MGAKVSVWDLNQESCNETVRLVREAGGNATFFRVDLSDQSHIDEVIGGTLAAYGSPYGLVNNASIYPRGSILEYVGCNVRKNVKGESDENARVNIDFCAFDSQH